MSLGALVISSEFPPGPGGIGSHAHQLSLNLQRMGWELNVVSPQDYVSEETADKFNASQPIGVVRVPSGGSRLLGALGRLKVALRAAKKNQPDALIGTGMSGVWVAAMVGAIRRLPVMAIAHGSEFGKGGGISHFINRKAFERMAAVVAVSQFTRGVVEKSGIKAKRMEVITNGADQHRFGILPDSDRKAFQQKMGFAGKPILLTVGHLSERKGQEVVIRAMPEILKKTPNAQYVMIGLPTLKAKLTGIATELGVQDHVHFLGNVSGGDLLLWLNCCDIFLMTSRTTADGDCEGFGIAAVEAALCGKPAIVSAQSGLIEAIQDGVSGIAVPEGNYSATAEAAILLLTNAERRQTMGQAANKRALESQTWELCASRYDAVLKSLVRHMLPGGAPQLQD